MTNFFDDLMESVNQAVAIHKGEIPPSRVFHVKRPDIKTIREKTGLSQVQFADKLHISPRTLQNWEQGRRYPTGAAMALINIIDKYPDILTTL